ncbi:MAG: glycosyltransferase family 1 protein, partial [Chloroflexota bacterium]
MKLGLDGTPLLGQRSGVGNYTGRLLGALMRANPDWQYDLYSNRPLGELEPELAGARQVAAYWPHSRWLWMQLFLPAVIQRSRPSLCHFTNSLAPLWQPRPFVLTIHDASLFLYRHLHPPARHLTMRLILPILARRAAAIITVSEHARQELQRVLGIPAGKIQAIHEAAPDYFRPVTDADNLAYLCQKYQLPEKFLLFVGTLEPRKNLTRLVRALGEVRKRGYPHRLVLVGPPGWLMDGFAQEIERLELQDRVQFVGYVPAEELPGLFSLATVFTFPSLYEGFGLPPLEAMACGAPVLTSNRSSLAEICAGAACLVDPEDEESIAAGLLSLLADEEWRRELAERGRR